MEVDQEPFCSLTKNNKKQTKTKTKHPHEKTHKTSPKLNSQLHFNNYLIDQIVCFGAHPSLLSDLRIKSTGLGFCKFFGEK